MPRITIVRPFKFTEITEVHPRLYGPGEQDVSERCAEVAIQEGWAVPFVERPVAGPPSPESGPAKPPLSLGPGQALPRGRPKQYKGV